MLVLNFRYFYLLTENFNSYYWKLCMRKMILPMVALTAGLATAADVEFHGNVNFDYASYFDDDFDPTNAGNQDIDLSMKANLDENVSVVVSGTTHSTIGATGEDSEVRHGKARSTAMGEDGRHNAFEFDGVQLRWDVSHDVSLIFGDMTYSAGAFNYYFWRDTGRYAVINREENLRGFGTEFGNDKYGHGAFYFGASDRTDHTLDMFATYAFPMLNHPDEHLILTPSFDWVFGQDIGRGYTYTLGTEVDYSKSFEKFNYGIYAVWGLHPYKGSGVHSFLLEPSMNYSVFNLTMTYFYAITNSEYEAAPQLLTEDQKLFAIEPSFNLHKKYTMGVSYEFHDPDTEIHGDDYHFLGMNHYLYPTMKTELVFWYGYSFTDSDSSPYGDGKFAIGFSGKASF